METKDEGVSHIDSLLEDMGMNSDPAGSDTDAIAETNESTDENQEDLSVSEETTDAKDENTDLNPELSSLKSQIEGMEKRLRDKDDYIKLLKDKDGKEVQTEDDTSTEEEEGFWDKPEETISEMKEQMRMQSLQLQEAIYANKVENYFETVNGDDLNKAISSDEKFAEEFNKSAEPYKVAYKYLTDKKTEQETSVQAERDKMRQEILDELKAGQPSAPTNISDIGSSNRSANADMPDDGFGAVFG